MTRIRVEVSDTRSRWLRKPRFTVLRHLVDLGDKLFRQADLNTPIDNR